MDRKNGKYWNMELINRMEGNIDTIDAFEHVLIRVTWHGLIRKQIFFFFQPDYLKPCPLNRSF